MFQPLDSQINHRLLSPCDSEDSFRPISTRSGDLTVANPTLPNDTMGAKQSDAKATAWKAMSPVVLFVGLLPLAYGFDWSWRWLISGAPALTFVILLGDVNGRRVLPFVNTWTVLATVNLMYSIVSTSWLLYGVFMTLCYPATLLTCVFQFNFAAHLTRLALRLLIKQVHFIDDKVALFDIPALEIDTEVAGLLVLRGITLSLSSLTLTVHGVEVGIKLTDELELAIQTEKVVVALFRRIDVADCFANIKGGNHEMTFGDTAIESLSRSDSDNLFATDSPLLKALSSGNTSTSQISDVTNGNVPEDSSPEAAVRGIQTFSSQNDPAGLEYQKMIQWLQDTSAIHQSREHVESVARKRALQADEKTQAALAKNDLRASICSDLHSKPSVTNPPERSIKVTTLQNLSPPAVKAFLHRLPLLLRVLLNILSYFHTVHIDSITATASGRWIESMLVNGIFKGYEDADSQLQQFKRRISDWVSGANFAVQLGSTEGYSQVPVTPSYDIKCELGINTISVYRTLPKEVDQTEVARLKGAHANFSIPTFLLPHHEHLLPEAPSKSDESADTTPVIIVNGEDSKSDDLQTNIPNDVGVLEEGVPQEFDETNVKISAHASLPAVFNQELLDFIAILVKASKLVEVEQQSMSSNPTDEKDGEEEKGRLSDLKDAFNQKFKLSMTKVVVANDQWLARQVGKVMNKLEQVSGDLGYSGDIPVKLAPYRQTNWAREGNKLLP